MSIQTPPKINNKCYDDQDDNKAVEVNKEWDQKDIISESESCRISNSTGENVEPSTSGGEVSGESHEHLDTQDYEAAEITLKIKTAPRAIEKAQNKYKRSLTSPKTRKPQVVKKPKLDYNLKQQIIPESTSFSHANESNMADSNSPYIAKGDNECCNEAVKEEPSTSRVVCCDAINLKLNGKGVKEHDNVEEIVKDPDTSRDTSHKDGISNEECHFNYEQIKECDNTEGPQNVTKNEIREEIKCLEFSIISQDPSMNKGEHGFMDEKSKNSCSSKQTEKTTAHTCLSKNMTFLNEIDDFLPTNKQLAQSKVKSLLNALHRCPEGADAKLSLFMAACSHNIRNLYPFPNKIFEDNDANRHLLYFVSEEIPSVDMIEFYLKESETEPLRKELMPVIDWLIRNTDPRLELIKTEDHKTIISHVSDREIIKEKLPAKIFRIKHRRTSQIETVWQETKADSVTKYAFYGCKVEDAYSILHRGLHNDVNCTGNLGTGFYMTDNLEMCVDSCTAGNTWGKSSIATKVKVIFIVEFIFSHSVMSYSGNGKPFLNDNSREENVNSRFYYTVKPQLGRMRYLLLYAESPSILPKNPFLHGPFKKKMIKYLNILRISLLIATILMGATASKRSMKGPSYFLDAMQNCYNRVSHEMVDWPIWNYVEIPYFAVHLRDSTPLSHPTL